MPSDVAQKITRVDEQLYVASETRRRRNVYNTHKPLKPVETAENIPVGTKLAVEQMAWYILTE